MAEQALPADLGLDAYLERWRTSAFHWRAANCVHFAAGWAARRVPGAVALAAADLRQLAALKRRHGGLIPAVTHTLERNPCRPAEAGRGDLAALPLPRHRHALGIVNGSTVFILQPLGIDFAPLSFATVAWRLP